MSDTSPGLAISYLCRASSLQILANSGLLRLVFCNLAQASSGRNDFFVHVDEPMRCESQSDDLVPKNKLQSVDLRQLCSYALQDRVHHVRGIV